MTLIIFKLSNIKAKYDILKVFVYVAAFVFKAHCVNIMFDNI